MVIHLGGFGAFWGSCGGRCESMEERRVRGWKFGKVQFVTLFGKIYVPVFGARPKSLTTLTTSNYKCCFALILSELRALNFVISLTTTNYN